MNREKPAQRGNLRNADFFAFAVAATHTTVTDESQPTRMYSLYMCVVRGV
jgi:hypothetical protein